MNSPFGPFASANGSDTSLLLLLVLGEVLTRGVPAGLERVVGELDVDASRLWSCSCELGNRHNRQRVLVGKNDESRATKNKSGFDIVENKPETNKRRHCFLSASQFEIVTFGRNLVYQRSRERAT